MTSPYDLSHIRSGSDLSEAGDALLGGDLTADDLAALEDFSAPKEFSPKILAAAIAIHGASFFTTGIASGPPDAGDGLAAGVDAFQGASEILGSAGSDPGWQGAAALSYDDRNIEQQSRTNQMADLDTELAGLLETQAAEVKKLRNDMYIVLATLTAAIPTAWALYKIPPHGPAMSTWFQIGTATACLSADTVLLTKQGQRSQETGAAIDNVASRYGQITAQAQASLPLH